MLYKAKTLKGFKLRGKDGELGTVKELYFDDKFWTVRYLVADTGNWLSGRQVLISPYSILDVNVLDETVSLDLTKKQIEESPPLETDKPVSKQFEQSYYGYYGLPLYWGGAYMWGGSASLMREREMRDQYRTPSRKEAWDPHLRSIIAVSGYHLEATDGGIGHVEDFFIDAESWTVRYLLVDTKNFWPGKKVLVSPEWIDRVSWGESKVYVDLSCDQVKLSPIYNGETVLDRD